MHSLKTNVRVIAAIVLVSLFCWTCTFLAQQTIYWKKDYIHDASGAVIVVATPVPDDQTLPTQPSGLNCTTTSTTIQLSWTGSTDAGSGIAGYRIYRGSIPVGMSTTTSFPDSTIQPHTTYSYTVVAVDVAGNASAASGNCSFTTWPGPWQKIAGDGALHSWPAMSGLLVESLHVFNDKLYVGLGTTTDAAMLFEFDSETQRWHKMGGGEWITTGSWGAGYEAVTAIASLNGKLYAGLGTTTNDAEVWELNLSTLSWTKVGGDGQSSSWSGFEVVRQLGVINGKLYAGLGQTGSNGEVWQYDPAGPTWTKIGGGGNAPFPAGREAVRAMTVLNSKLYVGLGDTGSDAAVWQWDPSTSTWTKIGDTGSAPWPTSREQVQSLTTLDGKLYAGLGNTNNDAAVWQWNPSTSTWTKVGGDGVNSSWASAGNYESVRSLTSLNGKLYAGLGSTSGDAELWQYVASSTSWAKVAGDGLDSSWSGNTAVTSLAVLDGELAAGTTGPQVWMATLTAIADHTEETVVESDSFDYASGNIGSITAPWSLRGTAGTWSVTSAARLRFSAAGVAETNWRGAVHDWTGPENPPTVLFSEVTLQAVVGFWGNGGAGPGVRYASSSSNDEIIAFVRSRVIGTNDYQTISRRPPTGSDSYLWSSSTSLIGTGDVMRIEVWHGSIFIAKRNGAVLATVRFVPSAGGLKVGMVGQSVGSGTPLATLDFDNWQTGIID